MTEIIELKNRPEGKGRRSSEELYRRITKKETGQGPDKVYVFSFTAIAVIIVLSNVLK